MSDIDEIKRRMEKRKARANPTLTDHHFLKLYNGMIKSMVVLMVVIAIGAYVKISPNGTYIKDYVLNDMHLQDALSWLQGQFFIEDEQSVTVSSKVSYVHVKDNYYTNNTNEVLNFSKGRVIYTGNQELLGNYVTILLDNNIEVTFGALSDVFVGLYDTLDEGTIIGTCEDEVMIVFTQGEKEIDYDTFETLL